MKKVAPNHLLKRRPIVTFVQKSDLPRFKSSAQRRKKFRMNFNKKEVLKIEKILRRIKYHKKSARNRKKRLIRVTA